MQRGTLVVLSMVLLGLALAGLALSVRYRAGDRALSFWTPPVAVLIAEAPRAELWRLAPASVDGATRRPPVSHAGDLYRPVGAWDLAPASGFIHARQALLEDASFAWDDAAQPAKASWQYALWLDNDGQQALLLFDLDRAQAALVGREGAVSMAPLAPKLRIFFADVLSRPQAGLVAD